MHSNNTKVFLYDTTLRDGTQGEGISFSVTAKLELTKRLDAFGVDYIEGGWPGSNPRDMAYFEAVKELNLKHAKVAAFGSTRRANTPVDEDAQIQLLLDAETPVVTIFGKTWLLHVTDVLRTTPEENLAMIEDSVRYLVEQGREVIYDAEHFFDGAKDDLEYAMATLNAAAKGGASFLTLCDTNGGMLVPELSELASKVVEAFPQCGVGIHCHNDGGLGVALSLAAVDSGATLVQGCLNGYGERTGNANMTSVIPNLVLKMNRELNCSDNLSQLRELSVGCDDLANLPMNSKAPWVGKSAFAHKGGVHANAAQKVAISYEHVRPGVVGNKQRILLSDMAGGSSVAMKAKQMGFDIEEKSPEMRSFLQLLKEQEFKGYEYENADASFEVLLRRHFHQKADDFFLMNYRVITEVVRETGEIVSEAAVKLRIGDVVHHNVADSSGPVGALDHAMRKCLQGSFPALKTVRLMDYKVRILERGMGTEETVQVRILSTDGKDTWWTTGAGANIIEASWEALRDSFLYKLAQS